MELRRSFRNLRFTEQVIRKALSTMDSFSVDSKEGVFNSLSMVMGEDTWSFDDLEDFFAQYMKARGMFLSYSVTVPDKHRFDLRINLYSDSTIVAVQCAQQHQINSVMNLFQESLAASITPDEEVEEAKFEHTIFVGHGRSQAWKELKDHLQDKHGHKVIAFETGARAGHQIRDILEDMLDQSSLALMVLTGEDETVDSHMRARQNVIHETGLFQGRLGFSRAIVLLEDGVEQFSNLYGIQHIPFAKGHINGAFGDVLAVIRRESRGSAT